MIRTATITWITFRNYGTYLQAYALQHVLRGLGYENRIIDDKSIIDKKFPPAELLIAFARFLKGYRIIYVQYIE